MRRRYLNLNLSLSENMDIDLSKDYFAVEFLEDNSYIYLRRGSYTGVEDYYYCNNNKSWTLAKTNSMIKGNKGLKIYFKGNLTIVGDSWDNIGIGLFEIPNKCNISGNILSLVFNDDFEGIDTLYGIINDLNFESLFENCSIIDASLLKLSAIKLTRLCYYKMFKDCTLLVAPPELPATMLETMCYLNMFQGCTSLVTAPTLPATTLAGNCYYYMFEGCSSLVTAPELPATTLAGYCYSSMFKGCTLLNYIKMLATNVDAQGCLDNWVTGVSSTGTFIKNKNATWNKTGVHGVPTGWTVQTASS